ncbi:hypothetical protein [Methylomonas rosea]|uniref:Uncharacterized protein n=1 Tax=Methylomonas rosea TaxID=2952227 RepID=A0ABT1TQF8_9GAMM|nr:hypothetical protein [Methylomonas sp. WSC-7]MCQ8116268.1 hypothetical protein [Methylomonas sp. WSC-7]
MKNEKGGRIRVFEDNLIIQVLRRLYGEIPPEKYNKILGTISRRARNKLIGKYFEHKKNCTNINEVEDLNKLRGKNARMGFHESAKVPGSNIRKIDK